MNLFVRFIRHAFDKLNDLGYFEENVNIIFTTAEKEHRREFEKFVCCDSNYKRFLRNYLDLKVKISKDKKLAKSIIGMYKDLLYTSTVELKSMYNLAPLIMYLFMDTTINKLSVGNLRISNNFTNALNVLFNEKLSMRETVRDMHKCLGVKEATIDNTKYVERLNALDFDLFYLQTYLYLYSFYLIQTKLYTSYATMTTFENGIRNIHNSYIDLNDKVSDIYTYLRESKISIQNYLEQTGLDTMPTTAQILDSRRFELDELLEHEDFTSINRIGYLKEEYCRGNLEVIKKGLDMKFDFSYDIREVVNEDGIEIVYTMYSTDFIVTVIEDYTRGKIFSNLLFYDINVANNTGETILSTLFVFYLELRKLYLSMISDKEKVTNEITLDDIWHESYSTYANTNYIKKPIFIAPHKRKYAKGCVVDQDKKKQALKFNIVLEDNEVFINSFIRKQRYLKDNEAKVNSNINDLRVGRLDI